MKINIGKPIANTQIYVLDKYLKPVPIGVTGELCIAGNGVGAGYLNQPELTAERFIDNPFGAGKLYRTGDLAYWRYDGNLVYVGRNDFQVKIRGLRIELGEIENAISSIDGIAQSAVVVRNDESGRQLICAFYTGNEYSPKDIRNEIGKRLPKYMLPHIITHLDEMPLTLSGKTDRKALPAVSLNIVSEYVAPQSELQQLLCRAFAKTLGLDRVGITDDFFDLGGDSLRAMELICNVQDEGLNIDLQRVFEYPTVEALAKHLTAADIVSPEFKAEEFLKYEPLLKKTDTVEIPHSHPLNTVFLTGATGFLGAHVLDSLLSEGCKKVYCLVRDDAARLEKYLAFYFGDKYHNDSRIIPVLGDLDSLVSFVPNERIEMVIHTAANVKHYGNYCDFHHDNVEGTTNAAAFAKRVGAKLIHLSTTSVSGADILGNAAARSDIIKSFDETDLYIGQNLDNVYIRSKFLAECAVLDATLDGLQANIIRVGNLTNRRSDGVFQPNYETNAFLKRFKSIIELGCFPDYLMDLYAEFSPIDDTAAAVVRLAEHFNAGQLVYHVYNNKHLYFKDLMPMLKELGYNIDVVSGEEFAERLMQTRNSDVRQAMANDFDENGRWSLDSNIRIHSEFSADYLEKLGFCWHDVDHAYLKQFIEHFNRLGFIKCN